MDPKNMTQAQRQQLWDAAGHPGIAPVGYGGESGGGGTNGYSPASSTDVASIRSTVYNTLRPYYIQLAKEAQGDFNRAVAQLQEDYVTNTRNDKVSFAFTKEQQTKELTNTLATLGITNVQDQRDIIDKLNQRGMAVYQNNPDGTPNALRTSDINANPENPDLGQPFNNTSTIANPANPNMGEGGYELSMLQNKQKLQQEAQQRAATKPIEQAGIALKEQTNLPAGIDPNQSPDKLATALAAPGVDRSQLGAEEQNLVRGTESQTRNLQQTQEQLNNQLGSDVTNTTSQIANTSDKAQSEALANELQKEKTTQFVNTGTGA